MSLLALAARLRYCPPYRIRTSSVFRVFFLKKLTTPTNQHETRQHLCHLDLFYAKWEYDLWLQKITAPRIYRSICIYMSELAFWAKPRNRKLPGEGSFIWCWIFVALNVWIRVLYRRTLSACFGLIVIYIRFCFASAQKSICCCSTEAKPSCSL